MNPPADSEAPYDPDLPDANSVIASLCCVATQYASRPSTELAQLALDLARKLAAPEYAESERISEIAQQLVKQWNGVLRERRAAFARIAPSSRAIN